jgi:hypothetical protein
LERSLFNHWSVYEILAIHEDRLLLQDLLLGHERSVLKDESSSEFRGWKVEIGQLIQCRLFSIGDENSKTYFFTHRWLHPAPEDKVLKKLCLRRQPLWTLHKDLLLSAFEAAVRSYGIQSQIKASGSRNWLYQDLQKRFAA